MTKITWSWLPLKPDFLDWLKQKQHMQSQCYTSYSDVRKQMLFQFLLLTETRDKEEVWTRWYHRDTNQQPCPWEREHTTGHLEPIMVGRFLHIYTFCSFQCWSSLLAAWHFGLYTCGWSWIIVQKQAGLLKIWVSAIRSTVYISELSLHIQDFPPFAWVRICDLRFVDCANLLLQASKGQT